MNRVLSRSLVALVFICTRASSGHGPALAASGKVKNSAPVSPLKGVLDRLPMLNSNCPEVVNGEGLLVSTFHQVGQDIPENHLNYKFKGDFAIFAHHINKQSEVDAKKTLYVSWIAYNPLKKPVKLTIFEQASYLSQPDAPFVDRPKLAEDDANKLYSGPGDRLTSDFVHSQALLKDPYTITVAPGETKVVRHIDVPVADLKYHHNGRSFFARGTIDGALEMATIATFSESGEPSIDKLKESIKASLMARPREYEKLAPTPDNFKGRFIYGRVAGVQRGVNYVAVKSTTLTKNDDTSLVYPVSALVKGTFGTGEIQSAPLLRRYSDTAYSSHGNYCVDYKIKMKVTNSDYIKRKMYVRLDCPLKTDLNEIKYAPTPEKATFFRGAIKASSAGYQHFYHFVLHKGENLEPFDAFEIEPGQTREIAIELLYPPDATPPQALTFFSPKSEEVKVDLSPVLVSP